MDQNIKKLALRQISYGLYIMSASDGTNHSAGTINWLSQASFQPPMVMVAVKADSRLYELVEKTKVFAINILSDSQKQIAEDFFRPTTFEDNKLNGHSFIAGDKGAPILDEIYAHFECTVSGKMELGDHVIFAGEVVSVGQRGDGKPLEMSTTGWFYGG
ncbi:MAG TPA: flavin reductase family protein [SAR202 cluster bacterium]|nr:flavin reductase family protein [SAR202 cluster bacterium]